MKNQLPVIQNPHLDGASFFWEGSSIGALLIHGFTATTTEVRFLADSFHDSGLTVSAPLLPGHGTTPQDMNSVKYKDWVSCVEGAYAQLREKCSQVIVGGESMGALLALYLAQKYSDISALLLYSTAIKVENLKYANFLKWFTPLLVKPNNDLDDKKWQGYTVYPMKAAVELSKLQKIVASQLAGVTQPALILQGIYDKTIDKDCGQLIYNAVRSKKKDLHIMNESGHAMLLGIEMEKITQITKRFLKSINIL